MEFETDKENIKREFYVLNTLRKIEWIICDVCQKGFKFYNTENLYIGSKTAFPFKVIASICPYCDNYVEVIEER